MYKQKKDRKWEREEERWCVRKEEKLRERKDREEGKSIIERWLLQARTPASQDQTWRPQRERPAGTASGGGCQGLASGGSSEGSLQHSRPCPALAASALTSWQLSLSLSSCNATLYLSFTKLQYHLLKCIYNLKDQFRSKFYCPKFVIGNGTVSPQEPGRKVFLLHFP